MHDGLALYLAENGFGVEEYDKKWAFLVFFGIRFKIPNPPSHRRALMLHDLHHVLTGYGTDVRGEGEITAWELGRGGLFDFGLYVAFVWVSGVLLGLLLAPSRTWTAWRLGAQTRGSLYHSSRSYEELLAMTVGDVRRELELPTGGLATAPRKLHSGAPARETARP